MADVIIDMIRTGALYGFAVGAIAFIVGYAFSVALDFFRSL